MSDRGAIFSGIVMTINIELRQSANGDLVNVRHEVIGDSPWIFPNLSTLVGTNRIEVSKQNDPPFCLRPLDVSGYFFYEQLCSSLRIHGLQMPLLLHTWDSISFPINSCR